MCRLGASVSSAGADPAADGGTDGSDLGRVPGTSGVPHGGRASRPAGGTATHLGALEDAEYLRRLTGLTDLGLDGSHAGRTYLAASGRYQRARETALLLEDLWDELFPGQAPLGRLQFRLEHDRLAASLLPPAVTGRSGWLSREALEESRSGESLGWA